MILGHIMATLFLGAVKKDWIVQDIVYMIYVILLKMIFVGNAVMPRIKM